MLLICFGTRPEWLKIKPLLNVITNYKLLFTGQHLDLLKDINFDYKISILTKNNRLDSVIESCLNQFPEEGFDSVLVQGDTASAFACALAAFHKNKKIYYLEAGLRSNNFNHPYPEEGYRQMISRISDINFCPTKTSKENLILENVKGDCHIVGNTILDNLTSFRDKCKYTNIVLITMHRRENHQLLNQWFTEINNLAKSNSNLKFILPIHPNPAVQRYKNLLTHVNIIDPVSHTELLNILIKCKLVITDSGGIQEEGSFFNKKIIVCRETTERPEAIETGHLYLCLKPSNLREIFYKLNNDYYINSKCPYGDGTSSLKIKNILNNDNSNT